MTYAIRKTEIDKGWLDIIETTPYNSKELAQDAFEKIKWELMAFPNNNISKLKFSHDNRIEYIENKPSKYGSIWMYRIILELVEVDNTILP